MCATNWKKDNDKLKLLLVEADEETIKDHIPEAARKKYVDGWSTASEICLRIKETISQKKWNNWNVHHSAAKKSLPRTRAMAQLLGSTLGALKDA